MLILVRFTRVIDDLFFSEGDKNTRDGSTNVSMKIHASIKTYLPFIYGRYYLFETLDKSSLPKSRISESIRRCRREEY